MSVVIFFVMGRVEIKSVLSSMSTIVHKTQTHNKNNNRTRPVLAILPRSSSPFPRSQQRPRSFSPSRTHEDKDKNNTQKCCVACGDRRHEGCGWRGTCYECGGQHKKRFCPRSSPSSPRQSLRRAYLSEKERVREEDVERGRGQELRRE